MSRWRFVLGIVFWRVPESRDEEGTNRLDWWGALLVTIGLGTMVYGLIESSNLGLAIQWCSAPGSWRSHADRIYLCRGSQSGTNDAAHSVSFADFQRGKLADVPVRRLRRSPILFPLI